MSKKRNSRRRQAVEVVNPHPGTPSRISYGRALDHCRTGVAYWLDDGRLRFRTAIGISKRSASDVYVGGGFEIAIVERRRFPHTQWLHGCISQERG